MGEGQKAIIVTEEFVESELVKIILEEDISNNVRRNVEQQEALPLVSSSTCNNFISFILLLISILMKYVEMKIFIVVQ